MTIAGSLRDQRGLETINAALHFAFRISGQSLDHSTATYRGRAMVVSRIITSRLTPRVAATGSGEWTPIRHALISGPLKYECFCGCCTSPFSITPDKRFAEYVDQFPSLRAKSVQHDVALHFSASIKTFGASHF